MGLGGAFGSPRRGAPTKPRPSERRFTSTSVSESLLPRRKLRELFRRGRISLGIALAFLTACIAVGDVAAAYLGESRLGGVIREGFLIGGWVAMWRPLEVFLYDWWPIRAEGRLLQRLSTMPVRIEYRDSSR